MRGLGVTFYRVDLWGHVVVSRVPNCIFGEGEELSTVEEDPPPCDCGINGI